MMTSKAYHQLVMISIMKLLKKKIYSACVLADFEIILVIHTIIIIFFYIALHHRKCLTFIGYKRIKLKHF